MLNCATQTIVAVSGHEAKLLVETMRPRYSVISKRGGELNSLKRVRRREQLGPPLDEGFHLFVWFKNIQECSRSEQATRTSMKLMTHYPAQTYMCFLHGSRCSFLLEKTSSHTEILILVSAVPKPVKYNQIGNAVISGS